MDPARFIETLQTRLARYRRTLRAADQIFFDELIGAGLEEVKANPEALGAARPEEAIFLLGAIRLERQSRDVSAELARLRAALDAMTARMNDTDPGSLPAPLHPDP